MIVIKLCALTKKPPEKKKGRRKKKAENKPQNPRRSTILVNGSHHYVVEITENDFKNVELKRLLSSYRGQILLDKRLEKYKEFAESSVDLTPCLTALCFKAFFRSIILQNDKTLSLCIKLGNGVNLLEIEKLLMYVKHLTVISTDKKLLFGFQEKCFREYGVKPQVYFEDICTDYYDIYADFSFVKDNGFLKYRLFSTPKTIYPDFSLMNLSSEAKKIVEYGVGIEGIYAAFGTLK